MGRGTHHHKNLPSLANPRCCSPWPLVQDNVLEVLCLDLWSGKTGRWWYLLVVTPRLVHLRFAVTGGLWCKGLRRPPRPDGTVGDPVHGCLNIEGHSVDVF